MNIDMQVEICSNIFKALSDSTRLKILNELSKQDSMCVCDLVEYFDISQSKLSYHLKMLLDCKLIAMDKLGKWNYYRINKKELEKYLSKELIINIIN